MITMETIPHCDIRIDKEGTWYYRGAEMFRREFVNFFYAHLKLDERGSYLIELPGDPGDRCFVEVEDTAFVVKSVSRTNSSKNNEESIMLLLSDDSQEALVPETLHVGKDNVLYCVVKDGDFKARFTRSGYYQMTDHIEYDEESDAYFVTLKDQRFYIQ